MKPASSPAATIALQINGQTYQAELGSTVAAALATHAQGVTRASPCGELRSPFCGMGVCQECRVSIDGQAQQLACQTLCAPGMQIHTALASNSSAATNVATHLPTPRSAQEYEIVIIGAGPAGQAAALRAASLGRSVALVDDNPLPGGQIWRGSAQPPAQWAAIQNQPGIRWFPASRVVQTAIAQRLLLESPKQAHLLHYQHLLLATGAQEHLLPFPGWTLRGVSGLGGLQALAKGGYPLAGKRVVLAGSGPLLLAVAATIRASGGQVIYIAEQASHAAWRRFALQLWQTPSKIWQAAGLWREFAQLQADTFVRAALPAADGQTLAAVRLQSAGKEIDIPCDYLACGYGLQPNTRLAQALGCHLQNGALQVNAQQQSSLAQIWGAGEICGIGGADKAKVEGEIAALAICGESTKHLHGSRQRWQRFAAQLQQAFTLRPELAQLAQPDTIICRCEDVKLAQLQAHTDWRSAKLQTRCGMGACQGRICGNALQHIYGWDVHQLREPLGPVRLGSLLQE